MCPWRYGLSSRASRSSARRNNARRYTRASPRIGEVAEWSNAPDSKSGLLLWSNVGSNPTLSAKKNSIEGINMTVARISEISSVSKKSFEDAILQGVARANKTLKNVKGAWVKDQEVQIEKGKVTGFKVILKVTFVLND